MSEDVALPLPSTGDAAGALAGRAGHPLTVGLRPEDLHLAEPSAAALPARVEAVEPVGNEAFLDLACGGNELVVRLPPHGLPAPGDTVHLAYAADRMHFFDPASGLRLEARGLA